MTVNKQIMDSTAVLCSASAGVTFLLESSPETTQPKEDGNEGMVKAKMPYKRDFSISLKTTLNTPSNCRGKGEFS